MAEPLTQQKTLRLADNLIAKVMQIKNDFDFEFDVQAYTYILEVGARYILNGQGAGVRLASDESNVNFIRELITADRLPALLLDARQGVETSFYHIADVRAIMAYEHARIPLEGDILLENLLRFQFFTKIFYLYHVFNGDETGRFNYDFLIPADLYTAIHPLIGLLSDIDGRLTPGPRQQMLLKKQLAIYREISWNPSPTTPATPTTPKEDINDTTRN